MIIKAGNAIFSIKAGLTEDGLTFILISELINNTSVTNNAEAVIQKIVNRFGNINDSTIVVYRDIRGVWDGIKVENNCFVDFYYLGVTDGSKAVNMAATKYRCFSA